MDSPQSHAADGRFEDRAHILRERWEEEFARYEELYADVQKLQERFREIQARIQGHLDGPGTQK